MRVNQCEHATLVPFTQNITADFLQLLHANRGAAPISSSNSRRQRSAAAALEDIEEGVGFELVAEVAIEKRNLAHDMSTASC